ncbi:MAG: hypothetical protein Q8S09_03245 [Hyphomonas sp.]|nr:hypothetical protein [Hyphomonas sp.]
MNWRSVIILGIASFSALAAAAEIPEARIEALNAAIASGDERSIRASALSLADAAIADPSDPQAALLALQSAWTLCKIGSCGDGVKAARFAAAQPEAPGLPPAAVRALVAEYASWAKTPGKASRDVLDNALAAAAGDVPSAVTAAIYQSVYSSDFSLGEFARAERIASLARSHFALGGAPMERLAYEAHLMEVASGFNAKPARKHQEAMLHFVGDLRVRGEASGEPDPPEWIEKLYYSGQAWEMTMGAYFQAENRGESKHPKADQIAAEYDAKIPPSPATETRSAPRCKGRLLQRPPLRYPLADANDGRFGSVIVRFAVRGGKVVNPEVLAAVPSDRFGAGVVETVSKWGYELTEKSENNGCLADFDNVVLPVTFELIPIGNTVKSEGTRLKR